MTLLHRVLPEVPRRTLQEHLDANGGEGLAFARRVVALEVVAALEQSGLRGRGGAGFPTGAKWRTVVEYESSERPSTVVVNAAEGEPNTFKDRAILRADPYLVLEGALIAATVMGAARVVVGVKRAFTEEIEGLRRAIAEMVDAGITAGVRIDLVEGPDEYLFGEETALLEVVDGRGPFPRLAPPFRRGVDAPLRPGEVAPARASGLANQASMAGTDPSETAPPALVDNVETLANVALVLANGPEWFRLVGTEASPGTIVATVTGAVNRPGVGEVAMGTTMAEAIAEIAGGVRAGAMVKAVLNGVSGAPLTAAQLDTPLTYEDMAAAGSGLGTASLHVIDTGTDLAAVAAGVARFLAVESCGQCTPCKEDGLALAAALEELCAKGAADSELVTVHARLLTVADGARCGLARQQQDVVGRLVQIGSREMAARVSADEAVEPVFVSELRSIDGGHVVLDEERRAKQPDWSFDAVWSGAAPVDLHGDHRAPEQGY